MTQLIVVVFNQCGASKEFTGEYAGGPPTIFKIVETIITGFGILFPLSLVRSFGGLRYFSIVSLVSLFFSLIVLLVELPFYIKYYWPTIEARVVLANWDLNIFNGAGVVFFAFTN